jgi:hypothetical protein
METAITKIKQTQIKSISTAENFEWCRNQSYLQCTEKKSQEECYHHQSIHLYLNRIPVLFDFLSYWQFSNAKSAKHTQVCDATSHRPC